MSARPLSLQLGISWILRVGVVASVILEGAGIALGYAQTGAANLCLSGPACESWRVPGGNFFDFAYSTVTSLGAGLTAGSLVSLGIVTLMFTPYFRVLAAVGYYGVERDWKYVAITAAVLAIITAALLLF